MSESNGKKEAKLKASMEEFVEPLLKRIEKMGGQGPENQETIKELSRLVKATKGLVESRQTSESDFIGCFGEIERKIDNCECKENDQGEEKPWPVLKEKLRVLLEKQGVDLSAVSTNCSSHQDQERTTAVPRKSTNFKNGESSISRVTDGPLQFFEEYMRELEYGPWVCFNSLGMFPENAILKKSFLIRWWQGISPNEDPYLLFSNLVCAGMLEPGHAKKHNQIIDRWTLNPTFYRHLKQLQGDHFQFHVRVVLKKPSQISYVKIISFLGYFNDRAESALLNEGQKYLSSKYLINVLYGLDCVHLGKWSCIDLEPPDHIEVDDTKFLKHLWSCTRYLSLRGISRIEEIPQSIGKLSLLWALDLRACHNLEKLPEKPQSKLHNWFKNLKHLDVSECYLLDYMPYWMCELTMLEVLKGFVVGSVKKKQSCRLRDLSRLSNLRKLSIRITKNLDPKDADGMESTKLNVLTVIWAINEQNNENEGGKVRTISFPKTLEKLDLRCYPEAEAVELDPEVLPNLKRLYIRNGKLSKIKNGSGWRELEILRLRFLENLEMDWESELCAKFSKLKYVEYIGCPLLKTFPKNRSIYNMKEHMKHDEHLKENNADAVDLKIIQKSEAPLEENENKLYLQLTGRKITDSPRLALVAVLDVNRHMLAENKLEKLKTAMLFVINKLSCLDHFAIVTYSPKSVEIHNSMLQISESCQQNLEDAVNRLEADNTEENRNINLYKGLERGLDLINNEHLESQMTKCIILVSGGEEQYREKPIDSRGVSVHTFGFGKDHNPTDLKSIAYQSKGGTYSDVRNTNNLTKAFAVRLAELHSVAAKDLTLNIRSLKQPLPVSLGEYYGEYTNKFYEKMMVGPNLQRKANDDGSVTIDFGDICNGEIQKVLVYHLLPPVDEEVLEDVLEVSYSYRLSGKTIKANRVIFVKRMQTVPSNPPLQWDIMIAEETRHNIAKMIKHAIEVAETLGLSYGQWRITKVTQILRHQKINLGESNESVGLLNAELEEFMQMMESMEIYKQKRAFAHSFLCSHDRQRATVRGDDIEKFLSFATPSMLEYVREAEEFDADHSMRPAPADGDARGVIEIADANPLGTTSSS